MKSLDTTALVLLIIGGLNWGLVGIFDYNLVEALFGTSIIINIIYVLVAISAIWTIVSLVSRLSKQQEV